VASTLDTLGESQYVLVTTYRKDGRTVPTPVWVVRDGEALAIWTPTEAGKVKRIRRRPVVLVGPCDFRGNLSGDQIPGIATVLDGVSTDRVRGLLKKKYGVMGRLTVVGSLMRRGRTGTVAIRIALT